MFPAGTEKILLRTVVVLHYRHQNKNGKLGPGGGGGGGGGGGRLSKCSKTIYNVRTSIILFRTVACLYTYFYLAEHDLVFENSHIR